MGAITYSSTLTWSSRIARYAAAYARFSQSAGPSDPGSQVINGSKAASSASRTSPVLSAGSTQRRNSRSTAELHPLSISNEQTTTGTRERGLNTNIVSESPSKAGHRQPSIFPGVVRQRTRKKSLRQSSGSENDWDASGISGVGLSRSGILEPDGKGFSVAVPEEID